MKSFTFQGQMFLMNLANRNKKNIYPLFLLNQSPTNIRKSKISDLEKIEDIEL